ncbi:MAG: hypothetical protein A3A96_00590 [Candidatus Zambryskibacteria bacterium RIFCSPLOWO2_01_FULL_39_39]|uniref:Glycosyltransferase 2-like domain-containing protein n=1 Tax=Candidatus Zambryskibacteria bacterium RIFCSPLOWO2_01_FULL_39_39 TaxID=1802758 RepID=A0A1G2TXF8_9BACT|nr:MAG: hypothetical protein UT00_C0004G0013 [Parcubacteria group bacterium GW2011_GWA1_38_7]OHA87794.1 MAG: hypothetical protein A2644_01305 [Candidatus Zambryskibacteria bacterium RIFCSPHIGHO2_01_FULL_39_63]OHA94981.1 MAG: hypothetical protein A3B88_01210 [Candidatus Zambryskibacteria bacterium RIFCSPHIGHO2_02_FULL_39_19]OHA99162.1 MAG: hypothetical protein A3F20_03160 [Candidatus Zambryskibacteria bacterium RIFCSPHIGHO2_12_FULL_39_21]OHB01924.1 MAG: hypothetical protein A3A96_00590 [Candidat
MKLSIIIAFYNSHRAVARQVKYFKMMNLPDDIEFIFVDDGSSPPHKQAHYDLKNLRLYATRDKRPWTQGLARNMGAKLAQGEYLLMTDIDHILSKEAIMTAYNFTGDKMVFPRYFGVLLEDGTLTQDLSVLKEYGMQMERLETKRGLYASFHGNTWAMKKGVFELLGGYDEEVCRRGYHTGDDTIFNRVWDAYAIKKGVKQIVGPNIYIFPVSKHHIEGNNNPMGLFHSLSHEKIPQPRKK